MQSIQLYRYGAVISLLLLLSLAYRINFNRGTSNKAVAEADYLTNDLQQPFFENTFEPSCNCSLPSPPLSISYNQTVVQYGENTPVFVPEHLSPMPPDILDKINSNKHEDDSVMVTIANYPMVKELYNWIEWVKQAQEEKFVVFCLDPKLYLHLVVAGYEDRAVLVPDAWFLTNMSRMAEVALLDDARLSHAKTWILQQLAYLPNTDSLLLDVNQIMLHARTREYMHALLLMRSDTQLIATQDSPHVLNTGLMMIRGDSDPQLKRLLATAIQIQQALPSLDQQAAFNLAMAQMELNVKTGMVVLLDMIHFPNGHAYFESKRLKSISPFIVHANHKTGKDRIELLEHHQFWKAVDGHVDGISRQVDDIYMKRKKHLDKLQGESLDKPVI